MAELQASQVRLSDADVVQRFSVRSDSRLILLHACSPQDVLAARSVQVLVVSFGGLEGAQVWLEQTGCTFNMVLDPQRQVGMCVYATE